jgi:alpha-tubulin suppressor-like RCC1 family protein
MPTVVTDSSAQPLGGVQKIAAGSSHTCAISGPTAAALCWGTDDFGELGDGNFAREPPGNPDHCPPDRAGYPFCASPKAIPVVTTNGAALTGVTALAAGTAHVCAIIGGNPPVTGGNVQCWGWDGEGQLGDGRSGAFLFRPNPNDPASTILDAPAIAISAGSSHSCAVVKESGPGLPETARCWGANDFGQIGNCSALSARPAPVFIGPCPSMVPLNGVVAIAAGGVHTCALRLTPFTEVDCWGDNGLGQLGIGTSGGPGSAAPAAPVIFGQPSGGVREIAAGQNHTCALMNDRTVQCWGANDEGQLGAATSTNCTSGGATLSCSASPVVVPITDANGALPVAHIAAGARHTCAALVAGGVRCWGGNFNDQLGANTAPATQSTAPVAVGGVNTCSVPTSSCNGQCTDTSSDPQNCGGCNNACITGDTCMAARCQCLTPGTLCPAPGPTQVCADTTRDPNNCGACGRVCSGGKICVDSACVCPSGQTICGGRCVDLQTDNNDCGKCGRRCRISPPCNREEEVCTTCENGDCVAF